MKLFLKYKYNSVDLFLVLFGVILYFYFIYSNKWISDDGFIYLSYVKNFIEHGEFSFNLGEKVDASTGFVWLLLVTIFKKILFFLDYRQTTFLLSFILSIYSYLLVSKEILLGKRYYLLAIPLIFFTWFFISFSTSGLETPLISFLLILLFFTAQKDGLFNYKIVVIVSLLPFVRPELGILLIVYFVAILIKKEYKYIFYTLASALTIALLRYIIFGDILPNTAFVKLFSNTYNSGYWYYYEFFHSYPHYIILVLAFLVSIVYAILKKQFTIIDTFFVTSSILLLVYIYKSGGDFMHGRFFIAPIVLIVLWTVDKLGQIYTNYVKKSYSELLIASLLIVSAFIVDMRPYCQTKKIGKNWFHSIMNEQAGYERSNKNLHLWKSNNVHKWTIRIKELNSLSKLIDSNIGVPFGGIGQVRFYGNAKKIYIFDQLSLTQISGSLLDTKGLFRKIGHTAKMPAPLIYLNKKVTLSGTPDYKLNKLLTFKYRSNRSILIDFSQIDKFADLGLLPQNTWEKIDQYIEDTVTKNILDLNMIFFLKHRYPSDRILSIKIDNLYNKYSNEDIYSWISWYESNKELIASADRIQSGENNSLPYRYKLYSKFKSIKPLKTNIQKHSYITQNEKVIPLELRQEALSYKKLNVALHENNLVIENNGNKKEYLTIGITKLLEKIEYKNINKAIVSLKLNRVSGKPNTFFYIAGIKDSLYFNKNSSSIIDLNASREQIIQINVHPGQKIDFTVNIQVF